MHTCGGETTPTRPRRRVPRRPFLVGHGRRHTIPGRARTGLQDDGPQRQVGALGRPVAVRARRPGPQEMGPGPAPLVPGVVLTTQPDTRPQADGET